MARNVLSRSTMLARDASMVAKGDSKHGRSSSSVSKFFGKSFSTFLPRVAPLRTVPSRKTFLEVFRIVEGG